jgi:ribonuclease BN (tRNA processing enzyme)
MQIRFLGTGGAFEPEYGNSAAIISCNGKNILIDCGFTVYATLKKLDLIGTIDYVVLTHLHNDHCGSVVNLALHYFLISHNSKKKLRMVYPSPKFRKQTSRMMDASLIRTEDFVEWIPADELKELTVIDTFGLHVKKYQTWAYLFSEGEQSIVFSGDIGDGDLIFRKLKKKKLKQTTVFHELVFSEVPGHTMYTQLIPHLAEYPIYGYHCDPRKNVPENPVPLVADQPQLLLP